MGSAQRNFLRAGLVAVVSLVTTMVGFAVWQNDVLFRMPASTPRSSQSEYTTTGMAGLSTALLLLGISIALVSQVSLLCTQQVQVHFGTDATRTLQRRAAIALSGLTGSTFTVLGAVAFRRWAADPSCCAFLFCLGVDQHPPTAKTLGTSFDVVLAIILLVVLVPTGLVMLLRVCSLSPWRGATPAVSPSKAASQSDSLTATNPLPPRYGTMTNGRDFPISGPHQGGASPQGSSAAATPLQKPLSMQPYHATPWKQQLSRVIGVCAGIVACAVLTFWLPNDMTSFTASSIAYYAKLAVVQGLRTGNATVSELPTAYFRTGQVRVSDNLVLKLFPGNVFFYVYLLVTALIVFVLRQTQTGRYWMQRRIPQCACFTYGEAAFVAATALLVGCFAMYWLHDHNYEVRWDAGANAVLPRNSERWGRSFGHLAVLFLSLLLLPVGRQSVVVSVLGVSRDGLLWFHRAVGYAMLAATLAHARSFEEPYSEYVALTLKALSTGDVPAEANIFFKYSVSLVLLPSRAMLVFMSIFALNFVRRRYYELFYYTHLVAAYSILPVVLYHASTAWMYLLPGMTVLVADQMVRLWQRSAVVKVVHARVISEDTTELAFTVPGRWDMQRVHPGQYVVVCVPELSSLQWHPFTLTNVIDEEAHDTDANGKAEGNGTVFYVHIKSMGPKTWTGRLYDLARTGQTFSVAVEGPCGTPVDYRRYDDVVLVAGGIGVTPCVSIYGSLLRERATARLRPIRVRLIWNTRSASLVGAVADMLLLPTPYRDLVGKNEASGEAEESDKRAPSGDAAASPQVRDGAFSCDIYVTRSGELHKLADVSTQRGALTREGGAEVAGCSSENRGGHLRVHEGRPDIGAELRRAFTDPSTGLVVGDVTRKLVLVCGPVSLIASTVKAAAALGVVVHTEEFLL